MGILSSQFQLVFLKLQKSSLEFRIDTIQQTKHHLISSVDSLIEIESDLDPNSPEMRLMQARRHKLKLMEDKLEEKLSRYKSQLNAIDAQIDGTQKRLDQNIKQSFSF